MSTKITNFLTNYVAKPILAISAFIMPELVSSQEVDTLIQTNTVAVPNYIGDEDTKTVHAITCSEIADIDTDQRIGYYVMYEALADGYKACNKCLKSYNLK